LFYILKFAVKILVMSEKKGEVKLTVDQIPPDGALGLLALGDVGVKLWREARRKKVEEMKNIQDAKNEQKEGK